MIYNSVSGGEGGRGVDAPGLEVLPATTAVMETLPTGPPLPREQLMSSGCCWITTASRQIEDDRCFVRLLVLLSLSQIYEKAPSAASISVMLLYNALELILR